MEPRSVLITLSTGKDPRSSLGESIHSSLSLLSNNLQLLSYTRALDPPSRWVTNDVASTTGIAPIPIAYPFSPAAVLSLADIIPIPFAYPLVPLFVPMNESK